MSVNWLTPERVRRDYGLFVPHPPLARRYSGTAKQW